MQTEPNQNSTMQKSTMQNSSLRRALTIIGSLLGVALLAVAFMAGYFLGQERGRGEREQLAFNKRQLTENLDQPLRKRPLLQNVPDQLRQGLKEHGLRGTIIEIEEDTLLVDTPSGARTVTIAPETKFFQGPEKTTASKNDLKIGSPILVLSQGPKPTPQPEGEPLPLAEPMPDSALVANVIIINPAKDGQP